MKKFKTTLKNAEKLAFQKGLLAGRKSAKIEIAEKNRLFYQRGWLHAFRRLSLLLATQKNQFEHTALENDILLPDNGIQKIQKTLILQMDDFLLSYYDLTDYGRENATDIYAKFQNYCQKNDIQLPTKTLFGRLLSAKFFKSKFNGLIYYHGITGKINQP